jgi:hypothetical protein
MGGSIAPGQAPTSTLAPALRALEGRQLASRANYAASGSADQACQRAPGAPFPRRAAISPLQFENPLMMLRNLVQAILIALAIVVVGAIAMATLSVFVFGT